jgi:hypothetical protein
MIIFENTPLLTKFASQITDRGSSDSDESLRPGQDRDLWNIETLDPRLSKLLNKTATYVETSRPEYDLQVFTDDVNRLLPTLSRENEASKALTPEEIQSFRKSVGKEIRFDEYESEEHELTPDHSLGVP